MKFDFPRLGKLLSLDPLSYKFSSESNYSYAGNNPIYYIDSEGKEKITYIKRMFNDGTFQLMKHVDKDYVIIESFETYLFGKPFSNLVEKREVNTYFDAVEYVEYNSSTEYFHRTENIKGAERTLGSSIKESMLEYLPFMDLEGGGSTSRSGWSLITSGDEISPTKFRSTGHTETIEADLLIGLISGYIGGGVAPFKPEVGSFFTIDQIKALGSSLDKIADGLSLNDNRKKKASSSNNSETNSNSEVKKKGSGEQKCRRKGCLGHGTTHNSEQNDSIGIRPNHNPGDYVPVTKR